MIFVESILKKVPGSVALWFWYPHPMTLPNGLRNNGFTVKANAIFGNYKARYLQIKQGTHSQRRSRN